MRTLFLPSGYGGGGGYDDRRGGGGGYGGGGECLTAPRLSSSFLSFVSHTYPLLRFLLQFQVEATEAAAMTMVVVAAEATEAAAGEDIREAEGTEAAGIRSLVSCGVMWV